MRLVDRKVVHRLVLPFVARLHSLEQAGRLSGGDLNGRQARLAVTIPYLFPRKVLHPDGADGYSTYRPAWFLTLLRENLGLVANVISRTTTRKLETGIRPVTELREMANEEDHRKVAKLASLSVLKNFPKAERENALQALCRAFHAA